MGLSMNLTQAKEGIDYIIKGIDTTDEDMDAFLFSLGCYSGEPITVITRLRNAFIVSVKNSRYTIDSQLASAIVV